MANDDDPAGFLSRWSRRKTDVRQGRSLDEPQIAKSDLKREANFSNPSTLPISATPTLPLRVIPAQNAGTVSLEGEPNALQSQSNVAPTLDDVRQLTPESDFKSFMARGVSPDVKNAAMKKLFSDPHFNVMDRMDVYIDDYSQPDDLPVAMLRQMTSAKTLNLFDDESDKIAELSEGDKSKPDETKVVAQSKVVQNDFNIEPITHDHADLRLQPDPTPRPEDAEPKPV